MEIPKFNGQVKTWLPWWSQFKCIDEDETLRLEQRFQYLIQAVEKGTRAWELVNSFPPTAENYKKAIECLSKRYGKKELLVEVYVRELLSLVLDKSSNENTSIEWIYDKLETHLRALETLDVTTEMCAAMLFPLVESALPEDTLRTWQRHPTSSGHEAMKDRLDALMQFLQSEVETEQRIAMASSRFGLSKVVKEKEDPDDKSRKRTSTEPKNIPTAAGLLAVREPPRIHCIFCEDSHESPDCELARRMTLAERTKIVQATNACFKCLKIGHSYTRCKYQKKCSWCSRKHVLLMCRDFASIPPPSTPAETTGDNMSEAALANLSSEPEVFLQTLCVKLVNGTKVKTVRALIDHGSHRSYILTEIAQEMGYDSEGSRVMTHLLFGGTQTVPREHEYCRLHLRSLDGKYACNFQAYHQDMICKSVTRVEQGELRSELYRKSIILTDTGTGNQSIDLLIGADIAGKLYTGRVVQLESGATALETRLGWTVMGKSEQTVKRTDPALVSLAMFTRDASISQLWRLDVLGITDPVEQKSKKVQQQEVLDKFRETVRVDDSGRYEVVLPWKENHPSLPNNRATAERRLESTEKKLKAEKLELDYERVFLEWQKEGIIEEVPREELTNIAHYLPHRPVLKEGSTTRIRPVFDASAREKNCHSLNQCLETGPNLIEFIPSLIIRFREKRIGVISDIKKAFLQISVAPKERDALRFLWRKSTSPEVFTEYRHRRVVFGVSSSPFLLGATIELHLEGMIARTEREDERRMLQRLKTSFYVDNCVTSVDSTGSAEAFQRVSSKTMASGGFELRGWEWSHDSGSEASSPVLGLDWDKRLDVLKLAETILTPELPTKITKRTILSVTQKVFDPLGMASPTVLLPKLLLQKLWKTNLDWDTEVSEDVKSVFLTWWQELPLPRELQINRWALGEPEASVSLHLFVDASKEAYAAVIYARVETRNEVKVEFIEAKSRVAPKEKVTIPRLELLAATVGARLLNSVFDSLNKPQWATYCWTDSSTALAWIQRDKQWATFVFNRLQEIRRLTDQKTWRHVPGQQNPADLPSRGCTSRQLLDSAWLTGPSWLQLPVESWPTSAIEVDEVLVSSELSKSEQKREETTHTLIGTNQVLHEDPGPWYLRRFSQSTKIVRMVAWIRRFVGNSRCRAEDRQKGELSAKEFELAELALMRVSQRDSFVSDKDPRLNTMSVLTDHEGLIRLKSPVEYRKDTLGFRRPIILDSHHPIVVKLLEHYHWRLHHASIDTVMNSLRERVWVLQCRRAVRAVANRCIVCQRYRVKKIQPPSIGLPESRVRDARVFEITGVDFAGPLFLNSGNKVWICLFTCAVYRAVHLELVTSLSSDKFLEAFRRFIARRGRPSTVYADNGTNFRGAQSKLGVHWRSEVVNGSVNEIEWRFNPPSAPWWGGWWERLIRTMKDLLKRVLKRACLGYEELSTILCDCEAIINSRPLTYLAEDSQQLIPLSPSMFLQEIREIGVPDLDKVDSSSLNRRQKYLQDLREHFRQRFRIEYLGQLRQRTAQSGTSHEVKVGDLVLCGSDNKKRLDWPLARVIHVYPGKDGQVRVAKIKTAGGELTRPVQRLYALEMSDCESGRLMEDSRKMKDPVTGEEVPVLPDRVWEGAPMGSRVDQARIPHEEVFGEVVDTTEVNKPETVVTTTRRGRVVKLPVRFQR